MPNVVGLQNDFFYTAVDANRYMNTPTATSISQVNSPTWSWNGRTIEPAVGWEFQQPLLSREEMESLLHDSSIGITPVSISECVTVARSKIEIDKRTLEAFAKCFAFLFKREEDRADDETKGLFDLCLSWFRNNLKQDDAEILKDIEYNDFVKQFVTVLEEDVKRGAENENH